MALAATDRPWHKGKLSAGSLGGLMHRFCSAQQQVHLKVFSAL